MKAMMIKDWGTPKDLQLLELPDPQPQAGQVAIDVRAIGCNFFDTLIIQGTYQVRPPLPFAPGSEVAGVVRAVGANVTHVAPGDRVFAMLGWGGYATCAIAPAVAVLRMPDSMSFGTRRRFYRRLSDLVFRPGVPSQPATRRNPAGPRCRGGGRSRCGPDWEGARCPRSCHRWLTMEARHRPAARRRRSVRLLESGLG